MFAAVDEASRALVRLREVPDLAPFLGDARLREVRPIRSWVLWWIPKASPVPRIWGYCPSWRGIVELRKLVEPMQAAGDRFEVRYGWVPADLWEPALSVAPSPE